MDYEKLQLITYVALIAYIVFQMRKKCKVTTIIVTVLTMIVSITIFARIFWVLNNLNLFLTGVYQIDALFTLKLAGLKISGGLIGGVLGILLLCKIYPQDKKIIYNTVIEGMFLAGGCGKIVCSIVGCCLGKPTNLPWAISYPQLEEYHLHPVTIYEAITWWVGFGLLHLLKNRMANDFTRISIAVLFYIVIRMFLLEGLYANTPFMGTLTAKIIYFTIMAICITVIVVNQCKKIKIVK
ncbi:MAG: prolipoprotein diacylglyceryl transferase [Clostridia bacterium]|nr:prolipoprotein diacylglyceryl transferase [Clostridia bacterium]